MKRMFKLEMYRYRHSPYLISILGVLVICSLISAFSGTYDSVITAFTSISKDTMPLVMAGAIYAGLSLTKDFSSGMIRHYIAGGYSRIAIVLCKYLHYIFGCISLVFFYPVISVAFYSIGCPLGTSAGALVTNVLLCFSRTLPLYLAIYSIFFIICFLIHKGAVAMAAAVAASIFMVVFTNRLFYSGPDTLHRIFTYSPIIQIQEVAKRNLALGKYGISVAISVLLLLITLAVSVITFKREEMKG